MSQLDAYQVSGLPVIDATGKLVGNFSVTNLLAVWGSSMFEQLTMSVHDYLAATSPHSLEPIAAKSTDRLVDVVSLMIDKQVHRLWLVNGDFKPIGVVTMSDVCAVVCQHVEQGLDAAKRDTFYATFRSVFEGKALAAGADGKSVVLVDDINDKNAQWLVKHEPLGTVVSLQAANGKFVAVDAHHNVALRDALDADGHLLLLSNDVGSVAIHDENGGFLEPHRGVVASHKQSSSQPLKRQWWKMTVRSTSAPAPSNASTHGSHGAHASHGSHK